MKKLKNLFSLALVAVSVCLALPARAQTYGGTSLLTGGTNNVAGSAANAYFGTGALSAIDCTKRANIALFCQAAALQTSNTATVTFTFRQSLDGTTNNAEATSWIKVTLPLNGTNVVATYTNITVNAVGYLFLDSISNNISATAITNVVVGYSLKPGGSVY
jgi:hypothetical protein